MRTPYPKFLLSLLTFIFFVWQAQADWLVSSQTAPTENSVLRYSDSGAFLGIFAANHGLADPLGLTIGADGNVYVASGNSDQVLRFDGSTGAFLGIFASGGGLQAPINSTFGPDGNLYVSSGYDHILRFNGNTGAFMSAFVSGGALAYPRGLKFGPDGNLYVLNYNTAQVLRYNGASGAFMGPFVSAGSGGLFTPSDLTFGPDGNLYVTGGTFPAPGVFRYNGATGAFMNQFAVFPNNAYPMDLAFGPDHNLYVVSQGSFFGVLRFNGQTGVFMDNFISNASGGLSNPFGLAFLPTQSQPTNHPPIITCPVPSVAECGSIAVSTVLISDLDGDALTVVWTVNGSAIQTNIVPANPAGPTSTNISFSAELPLGTNFLTVSVSDGPTNRVSCSTSVSVRDTTPPLIVGASAAPHRLWPPNHKMVPIKVHAQTSDACGSTTWKIVSVTSNEPADAHGDGHTAPDWVITGDHTLQLRAERSGQGHGRIYTISTQAFDASGNPSSPAFLTVTVAP